MIERPTDISDLASGKALSIADRDDRYTLTELHNGPETGQLMSSANP
jgi:hypothetical protein